MEQKINPLQQKIFVNPHSEDEVFDAVQKGVEKAGLTEFKSFLNDYKLYKMSGNAFLDHTARASYQP